MRRKPERTWHEPSLEAVSPGLNPPAASHDRAMQRPESLDGNDAAFGLGRRCAQGGDYDANRGNYWIKAVIDDKPKMLSGLNQNGMWSGTGALLSPVADGAPPADRHDLNPE